MPIGFSSMMNFEEDENRYALLENMADAEEEDGREGKASETSHFLEEYIVARPSDLANGKTVASGIAFKNQLISYVTLDVLTPPPRIFQVI